MNFEQIKQVAFIDELKKIAAPISLNVLSSQLNRTARKIYPIYKNPFNIRNVLQNREAFKNAVSSDITGGNISMLRREATPADMQFISRASERLKTMTPEQASNIVKQYQTPKIRSIVAQPKQQYTPLMQGSFGVHQSGGTSIIRGGMDFQRARNLTPVMA